MFFNRCPGHEALAAYAAGETKSKIERHIQRCESCARLLEEFRSDEAWLARVRDANRQTVDDRSRRRIAEICRDAARET